MEETQTEINIPHLFRCPISLDLFEDPVTLCTGQTYDRSNIEKWISAGNFTCPVTMQKLQDLSIVPNHTLRHLIHQWLQLGPQFDHGIGSLSSTFTYLSSLKHSLESPNSTLETKFQSLEKIRLLSDEYCSFRKSCFHQFSFLPLLLELVFGNSSLLDYMEFVELALICILKLLPLVNLEPLNMFKDDESKLENFVVLFEKGNSSVKISLCNIIESSQTEEICHILGNCQKLVHEIVNVLVLFGQNCCEVSKAAIKAISGLCSLQSNRESLVNEGAINGIIKYISACEKSQQQQQQKKNLGPLAMETMMKLLVCESGKEALVKHSNGVEILVKMVFRVCNQECSESAVGMLLIVCCDFGNAREEAIEAGVLTQLLFLLQSQCSTKTKTKARMLLKLLRSKWDDEVPN